MKEKLETIARLSRFYGSDSKYVFLGGGNTSVKNDTDLFIKPSGVALATIKAEQFLRVDRQAVAKIYEVDPTLPVREREAMVNCLQAAAVRPIGSGRPSVEASVHSALDFTYIVHLHPMLVNGLTCSINGKTACAELFPEALWLDYCDPGCVLAQTVRAELIKAKAERGSQPNVIFIQNHGIFVGGNSEAEIQETYEKIMSRLSEVYGAELLAEPAAVEMAAPSEVSAVAPVLRTLLAEENGKRPVVRYLGKTGVFDGPLTPDHIVYAKTFAYKGEATRQGIQAFKDEHGYLPKVLDITGVGTFVCAAELKMTEAPEQALYNALGIQRLAQAFGGVKYMTPAQYGFIENWEAESYRSKVSVGAGASARLEKRVCLVTGGAQGFGLGIAESLLQMGGQVILADMNFKLAEETAAALSEKYGAKTATAVAVDISNEESVEKMFDELAARFGGVDLMVANAGVLRSGSVMDLTKKDWDFVTNINYTGYFLCCKHAARLMSRQIVDGEGRWMDIVQVNSKSGLEGSNKNGAYAGSKFGGVGLTQSFAKELVSNCIKVNSVCPGNYYDGPLWSDPNRGLFVQYLNAGKVPGATTVDDVKKFYMDKVPIRRGCLPSDVAKAIVYCVEQDYETGQAIPVTGGQVMLH